MLRLSLRVLFVVVVTNVLQRVSSASTCRDDASCNSVEIGLCNLEDIKSLCPRKCGMCSVIEKALIKSNAKQLELVGEEVQFENAAGKVTLSEITQVLDDLADGISNVQATSATTLEDLRANLTTEMDDLQKEYNQAQMLLSESLKQEMEELEIAINETSAQLIEEKAATKDLVTGSIEPLSTWKSANDACHKQDKILVGSECTSLLSSCPALKIEKEHVTAARLHNALEDIPGTAYKFSCKDGYFPDKDVTTTCLSSGEWSKYLEPTCKPCATGCANCASTKSCLKCAKSTFQTNSIDGACYATNCKALKDSGITKNDIYTLTNNGEVFKTYCDMQVDGGGWQLVASVHEDNIGAKCNGKDRWTNTNGNGGRGYEGLGNWHKDTTFGAAENACKDDFKSQAYNKIIAKDVMIWHVPNGASHTDFYGRAAYRYHTTNGFLKSWGGNLLELYKKKPPIAYRGSCNSGAEGPSVPAKFEKGNPNTFLNSWVAYNSRRYDGVRVGYIQFTVFNNERAANALCPGIWYRGCNTEHACVGGGGYFRESYRQCSDFSGWDWNGVRDQPYGWSAARAAIQHTVMIFTRS